MIPAKDELRDLTHSALTILAVANLALDDLASADLPLRNVALET